MGDAAALTDTTVPVPTGNTYDKYGSTNPIERRLMAGFFTSLDVLLPTLPPATVLEVGIGEGEVTKRVSSRYPQARFTGIDLPDPGLARHWGEGGLSGAFADITQLPFGDDCFDLVLAIEVLEHVSDPSAALAELDRVARDRLILSVPREPIWRVANMARGKYLSDLGNTPGHIQHWSARSFESFVRRQLPVDAARHPFPWTMVGARCSATAEGTPGARSAERELTRSA